MSSSKFNIGVVYPSRGLCFTETFSELLSELADSKTLYEIYWSHGNKLPACFNKPLMRALKKPQHTHILFLEDDMVIKKGILKELLDADEDIISCDYPIVKAPSGTVLYDLDDNAIFTGTGFMLAKRRVFDGMPRPVFRSDIEWGFKKIGDKVKFTARSSDPDKVYGHHDITFGLYQYLNNQPIKVAKTVLAQRKLTKKGEDGNNIGTDTIELYDRYQKINYYMIESEPVYDEKTVHIKIDGKDVMVSREHANKLRVEYAIEPVGNIIVDINNNNTAYKALRSTK